MTVHIDLGLSTEPFGNRHLQHIIRGINRFHREPKKKKRLPMPHGVLIHIILLLDPNDPRDANLYCAFCIVQVRFRTAGQITWAANDLIHGHTQFTQWNLTQRGIRFEEERLLLTLASSKTDPFCK
jgi:hypothetical protein